jgi:putative CocE/NonD family hydrolase
MQTSRIGLVVVALLAFAAGAGAQARDTYDAVLFTQDVMVPMRDGVRLATDVYRPARDGVPVAEPLPVLLQRTPYGKEGRGLVERSLYFVERGYVVVLQDTRGRYESEGTFSKYHDFDAPDGYDTVEWAAALPYGAGAVGMFGTSYGAHTQADAAKMNPPHLRALLLNQGGISSPWAHKVRNHGAFELGQQLGWAFDQLRVSPDPVVRAAFEAEAVADWFAAMPLRPGLSPLTAAPEFEDYVLTQMTRGDDDDPDADFRHWDRIGVSWRRYYGRTADVPMLHVAGWYDPYCGSMFENYLGLSAAKTAPMRLLVGPWTHGGNARSYAGDVDFGPDAALPDFTSELHRQWFDRHLKGRATEADDWPPIRLFVMGTGDGSRDPNGRLHHGGYWRDAEEWPLPEAEPTRYYFHADGTLGATPPAAGVPPTTYTYDPEHPVPTIGGSFSGVLKRGAYDQREREFRSLRGGSENGFYGSRPPYLPLKTRPDVVVFQTAPLQEPVEVVGPISVTLYASSTAVDTDFTVKLVDVYPPSRDFPTGFDMNVTDGILRARYRNSASRPEPMTPGEVYEFVIRPYPTANRFKAGHRIRIDVSSSNFPRFDVNPNTGEPLGRHRRTVAADNSIHHEAAHPSHVVLPVVPLR